MSTYRLLAILLLIGAPLPAAAQTAEFTARADRVVARENDPGITIQVLANDTLVTDDLADGELRVSVEGSGETLVDTRGTSTAADDRILYQPPGDFSGEDGFSYQICDGVPVCQEARVQILVRPAVDVDHAAASDAGFLDVELRGLRSLPGAAFTATAAVAPFVSLPLLGTDPTPHTPWDSDDGVAVVVGALPQPADGNPQPWQLLIDAQGLDGDVDLYLGRDANGDDWPDGGELLCTAAMSEVAERCEAAFVHQPSETVRWWVMVHNRHALPQTARVEAFQVHQSAGDQRLVATGPGDLPAQVEFPVRVAWSDPLMVQGEARLGYVIVQREGTAIGRFPVRIDRTGAEAAPRALSGQAVVLRLPQGAAHDRLFVDVPEGATQLRVVANSSADVDLYLARVESPPTPWIEPAPARELAVASATGPATLETVVVEGATLQPGRWYVTPVNDGDTTAAITVQATVSGVAQAMVRSGSYFNPERSGHGIFIYPAADQWTGLWYTYFQDGTPTWYYLQGPQPGANGIWRGTLHRSAWDGDANTLTQIGEAALVTTGDDAFVFTYSLDGETGSEPLSALGRGCPMLDGDPLDVSSTWFNPATAGTGYSVQMFPDYEFFASFIYDEYGVPRYLAAERTSFGGAVSSFDLEQLSGFCPLCVRSGDPIRQDVGFLARQFDSGTFEQVLQAAVFTDGVPGAWYQEGSIQPLGGPGTTQGCEL